MAKGDYHYNQHVRLFDDGNAVLIMEGSMAEGRVLIRTHELNNSSRLVVTVILKETVIASKMLRIFDNGQDAEIVPLQ